MASKRVKWRDRTPENDIKYGGFLSYRHLRIIGWLCLAIAQIAVVLKLQVKLAPESADVVDKWTTVIDIFGGLPVPLFLLANLSVILQKRGDFKSLFIKFGGLAVGMYILANFVVFHYGFRTMLAFDPSKNWADAARFFGELLPLLGKSAYTLNIFIDMLLVVLMFFFANYEPQTKIFQGKRIFLFRALIVLPIAYEVVGILLKYHTGMGNFSLPSPVIFLLPSKPPLAFAAFVVIVIGLKISEVAYLKRPGHSKETFELHAQTKAHSLKISIGMAASFVVMAILDLVLLIVLISTTTYKYSQMYPDLDQEALSLLIAVRVDVFENIGIGGAIGLILAAPLILLFSYTKKHKNPKIDTIIPLAGIALIALVLLEGNFQVITLNMPAFLEKIRKAINDFFGGGEGEKTPSSALLSVPYLIRNIHL